MGSGGGCKFVWHKHIGVSLGIAPITSLLDPPLALLLLGCLKKKGETKRQYKSKAISHTTNKVYLQNPHLPRAKLNGIDNNGIA